MRHASLFFQSYCFTQRHTLNEIQNKKNELQATLNKIEKALKQDPYHEGLIEIQEAVWNTLLQLQKKNQTTSLSVRF